MKRVPIVPPVYLAASIAAMAALHHFAPIKYIVAWPFRWIGLATLVAGLSLGFWAARLFRIHQTTIRPGQVSNRLLTTGPFGLSRNPIYISMVILLAGVAILFGSLSPWIMIPIFIAVIATLIIPVEEEMLQEKFGAEYEQYKSRVRRWI